MIEDSNTSDKFKSWLSEGKLEETLDALKEYLSKEDRGDLLNSVVLQQEHYQSLKTEINNGTVYGDEKQARKARIIQSVLHIIDELDDESKVDEDQSGGKLWVAMLRRNSWIILLLILLGTGIFVGKNYLDKQQQLELIEQANAAFKNENWVDASDYYARLIIKEPKNVIFLEKYGYSLYKKSNFKMAEEMFDKAISLSKGSEYQLYFFRGNVRLSRKNYKAALEDFDELLKQQPAHRAGYNQRGLVHVKMDSISKACADFQKAKELGNKTAEVNISRYCSD